jgi:hypothetical protein
MAKPIHVVWNEQSTTEQVMAALREHDSCHDCRGHGGETLYPEVPCSRCGFDFAESTRWERCPRSNPGPATSKQWLSWNGDDA